MEKCVNKDSSLLIIFDCNIVQLSDTFLSKLVCHLSVAVLVLNVNYSNLPCSILVQREFILQMSNEGSCSPPPGGRWEIQ